MFRGGSVCAAVSTAAAFVVVWLCLSACPSRAADDDETRFLLFSGRDIWRNGAFAHGGLVMAPAGLDQDGFLLKLVMSTGLYRYNASSLGGVRVYGFEATTQILPGWRMKRGDLEVKFFFGPDIQQHRLWPDDPGNTLRGHSLGLRMATELWYEPTPTTMLAADASLASIATSNSARVGYGWRVLDQFYAGPEIAFFASDGYRHLRLGVHFTALKTEANEWLAAGGWAGDSERRSSPYVRLGLLQRVSF
jgi:Cellulose biosynthesis protein BcsS